MIRKKKTAASAKRLELILPATSANLGPAFDAAALAFELYLRVGAAPALDFSVRATGRDQAICGNAENHLIITTYCEVLRAAGKPVLPLTLAIKNEMPIGKGCGSSAAARLAGIAMAVYFGDLAWSDSQIIGEAARREHHPDNAAACWVGGLAVARMSAEAEAQVVKVKPRGEWPLLFAVPNESLSTEEARRVLPMQYSRPDAVANVQSAMLLLMAFVEQRYDLLATALQDRIHQPYRSRLCPLLPALQEMTGKQGVLGVALSGAGPSVLVFLDPGVPVKTSRPAILAHLANRGLSAELISTSIAEVGAAGQRGWRKAHAGSRRRVR